MAGYKAKWRGRLIAAGGGDMRPRAAQSEIIMALCAGEHPDSVKGSYYPVETTFGPYRAIFHVASDALKIGTNDDYTRPLVSHRTLQAAADVLGMAVPTKRIVDAMADQAPMQIDAAGTTISGKRQTGTKGTGQDFVRPESQSGNLPATVAVQDEESERMDRLALKLSGTKDPAPFQGFNQIGKTWISAGRLQSQGAKKLGINHGFYSRKVKTGTRADGSSYPLQRTAHGWYIIQNVGGAHDVEHTDYSQRGLLVHRKVWVKGGKYGDKAKLVDIDELATDPDTKGLVWESHEPAAAVRHPWLPPFFCQGGEGLPSPEDDADIEAPTNLPWGASEPGPASPPLWPWLGGALGLLGLAWYAAR